MSVASQLQSIRSVNQLSSQYLQRECAWDTTAVRGDVVMRPMTVCDIPTIRALEARAYQFPWKIKVFLDCLLAQYQCWVTKLGKRTIAYGIITVGADESHLLNLCVNPDFHGQGYGRNMVQFLCDIAIVKNAKRMFLEVRPSNQKALALYLAAGFRQVGLRKNYYPTVNGREDALVLARLL